jgi:hypothetical protein
LLLLWLQWKLQQKNEQMTMCLMLHMDLQHEQHS